MSKAKDQMTKNKKKKSIKAFGIGVFQFHLKFLI